MKNSVKTVGYVNANDFQYLSWKFSNLHVAKLKKEVFVKPQTRNLQKDVEFEKTIRLTERHLRACLAFK